MYTSFLGVSSPSSSASPGDLDPGVVADLDSTGEPALLLISSCQQIALQLTSMPTFLIAHHTVKQVPWILFYQYRDHTCF